MSAEEAVVRAGEEIAAPALAPAARERPDAVRLLGVALPVAWGAALLAFTLAWGLPLARDQLFLWIALGLAAFSVTAWRSWGVMAAEWLPFFVLLVLYDKLRGAVAVAPDAAHVLPQLDVDRALAGGTVPTVWLQQHLWDPAHLHWFDLAIFAVYLTHFLVVWVVAALLWRASRPRFRRYVALVLLVTLGAFLTYWLFPAQPPWMVAGDHGVGPVTRIVPEVWDRLGVTTMQSVYEDSSLVNMVAAMPSLHAAYPMMLLLFFWPAGRWARLGLGAYTLAMGFTLVYGGEHFVTDVLAGWALALAAWGLLAVLWPRLSGSAWRTPQAAG